MLMTNQELTAARDKLDTARTLIDAVHAAFVGAGYIAGTHDLEYAAELIADEISQLDKAIAKEPALRLSANSASRGSV